MLGVGRHWEILLESDGNTPFIPTCRAEPGPKCFVQKSSAEMMSPYFWVMAMTVVPEKLMFCVSCGCPCLNLVVVAVIGHSFFLSSVLPLHSHPSSSGTLLFQQHSCFSAHVAQPPPGFCASGRKFSTFTPAIHFTSICLPENPCSVPTCACHRVKRALILELPHS